MFLLYRADLLALLGLFVQTFVAWIYWGLLRSLRRRSMGFVTWERAFLAFSLGLTALSIRFFQSHDLQQDHVWDEGTWVPSVVYGFYTATKVIFGLLIVRGSFEFTARPVPTWLNRAIWPVATALGTIAWALNDAHVNLVLQAPVMVTCAGIALFTMRHLRGSRSTGVHWVRLALIGLMVTWLIHCVTTMGRDWHPVFRNLLALNSFLDLIVQIVLGTGLIVMVLEEAHRRAREAESERHQLQREVDRGQKLKALGTLVSGVAHELNNPLTAILGFAQELENPKFSPTAARIVMEQAERCRGIIRNLTSLAAPSPTPSQEVELGELIERVVRGLRLRLDESSQSIEVPEADFLYVRADAIGLEQVMTNLIVNAIQANLEAAPDSPGQIRILLGQEGDEATIDVIDQGPGIPEESRAMLFEPFFTTKMSGRGLGLRLAVAHAIVDANAGRIAVRDGEGHVGARFTIHLPIAPLQTTEEREPREDAHPVSRVNEARLLVVDDEAAVRRVIRMHAEIRGFRVIELDRAEPLLDPAIGSTYDVALCDLRMPGIGGMELHDRLARDAPERLARIVFFTGDLASHEATAFATRCRRPLLQKPFDFRKLLDLLVETHERVKNPRTS